MARRDDGPRPKAAISEFPESGFGSASRRVSRLLNSRVGFWTERVVDECTWREGAISRVLCGKPCGDVLRARSNTLSRSLPQIVGDSANERPSCEYERPRRRDSREHCRVETLRLRDASVATSAVLRLSCVGLKGVDEWFTAFRQRPNGSNLEFDVRCLRVGETGLEATGRSRAFWRAICDLCEYV